MSLRAGGWLLGLLQQDPVAWFSASSAGDAEGVDAGRIEAMLRERERLRKERQFDAADGIRNDLLEQGIVIEDGAEGTRWRRA
jgi:cysteinyl-tRNA synthetase